jgi:hypothetical protein
VAPDVPPVESRGVPVSPPVDAGAVAPPESLTPPPVKPPELGIVDDPPLPVVFVAPPVPKLEGRVPPVPGDVTGSLLPEQAIRPTSVHRGNRERRCMMTMIVPHFLGPGGGFPHFQRGEIK